MRAIARTAWSIFEVIGSLVVIYSMDFGEGFAEGLGLSEKSPFPRERAMLSLRTFHALDRMGIDIGRDTMRIINDDSDNKEGRLLSLFGEHTKLKTEEDISTARNNITALLKAAS